MGLRVRNATFKLPLYPDPPASIHPEPVSFDLSPYKVLPASFGVRDAGAPSVLEQSFMNLAGIGHFASAIPSTYRTSPPVGYAIELRVVEFELDCRALDNKFDVTFTLSPVNIVVPEPPVVTGAAATFGGPSSQVSRQTHSATGVSTSIDAGVIVPGRGALGSSKPPRTSGNGNTGPATAPNASENKDGVRLLHSLQLGATYLHLQSFAGWCVCPLATLMPPVAFPVLAWFPEFHCVLSHFAARMAWARLSRTAHRTASVWEP